MIRDILTTIDLHFKRAKTAYAEIKQFDDDFNVSVFDDPEKIKTLDSFILRYIKIQDLMGEKLNFIRNTQSWMKYRNLRNTLTHEYLNNKDEIIEGIKVALIAFVEMEQIYHSMIVYLEDKKLI